MIWGESGNFGEYVVSCRSRESGNLNVFGDYDECGNFCECCYFSWCGYCVESCDFWKIGWSDNLIILINSIILLNLVKFVTFVILKILVNPGL